MLVLEDDTVFRAILLEVLAPQACASACANTFEALRAAAGSSGVGLAWRIAGGCGIVEGVVTVDAVAVCRASGL